AAGGSPPRQRQAPCRCTTEDKGSRGLRPPDACRKGVPEAAAHPSKERDGPASPTRSAGRPARMAARGGRVRNVGDLDPVGAPPGITEILRIRRLETPRELP